MHEFETGCTTASANDLALTLVNDAKTYFTARVIAFSAEPRPTPNSIIRLVRRYVLDHTTRGKLPNYTEDDAIEAADYLYAAIKPNLSNT